MSGSVIAYQIFSSELKHVILSGLRVNANSVVMELVYKHLKEWFMLSGLLS